MQPKRAASGGSASLSVVAAGVRGCLAASRLATGPDGVRRRRSRFIAESSVRSLRYVIIHVRKVIIAMAVAMT